MLINHIPRCLIYRLFIILSLSIVLPIAIGYSYWESSSPTISVSANPLPVAGVLPQEIYVPSPVEPSTETYSLFQKLIALEPSAREIQKAVIEYTHTSNDKFDRWHKFSRLKSLLPTFSFGKDFSESNNIDLDRGSTSTPDVYINGPEDIDQSWSADIRWDFSDLIWSSSQTSIDSREKITADFRQELLSEVTKIYFERRRLQTNIIFQFSETKRLFLEELLQIDELTALLDAMTDGFMSERLSFLYEQHPELSQLWSYQR